ncbi:MAG TPA: LLM class flavin-dependent oxidoreductase [Acidimicrobiales bacterium]|nr:LLM class flavin-dependent oxidoreductase [Acidimicrobiales bacterium]
MTVTSLRTGVVLPSFRDTPDEAMAVAEQAEAAGLDGVFCYDHLWPMGQPGRPALAPFPLLAAIARRTSSVSVGTLVARVGLVPDDVLVAEFDALALLAPGRVVAGLGTGDRLSASENVAYGVPFAPAAERLTALGNCARALRARGLPVWIGGGRRTVAVAEAVGAAVNLWAAPLEVVAAQSARCEVTWGGPPPTGDAGGGAAGALDALVRSLAAAGATWVVFGWPVALDELAAAAEAVRLGR